MSKEETMDWLGYMDKRNGLVYLYPKKSHLNDPYLIRAPWLDGTTPFVDLRLSTLPCDAEGCQICCTHRDGGSNGHCLTCGYEVSGNGEPPTPCPEGNEG